MYVSKISISNLRCFAQVELNLNYSHAHTTEGHLPNVNLLLGTNGAGKTTILKALALGTLSPVIQNSGYVPYYLIRRTKARHSQSEGSAQIETTGFLHDQECEGERPEVEVLITTLIERESTLETIWLADTQPPEVEIRSRMSDDKSPAFFVVGYGATRRVESAENVEIKSRKRRILRYQRVAGLFEEYIGLTSLGAWLDRETPSKTKEVTELLNSVLPSGTRFTGQVDRDGEPLFVQRGVKLPLGALSDGYRGYLGLVCDLIYHLRLTCPPRTKLTDLPGLVLVDDVDLHLHPSWQREVVPILACAFPRLQFVLTSHSPLVAGTLHAENIFLIEAEADGPSYVRKLTEPIHGLNADQILTSSYFDLETSRSPDARRNLARLARNAENGDTSKAVEFLHELNKKRATK